MAKQNKKRTKPKLVRNRKVVKLSSADWERWDPEDAVHHFSKLLPDFSDAVLIGRNKADGTLVIYTSNMMHEYAHLLLCKASGIILEKATP